MHPAAGHTFRDFILRVAERAGIAYRPDSTADNAAQIPLDPHDLDRVKRAINDGRKEMYNRAADSEAMRPRLSFTLDPDGAPENIGGDVSTLRLPWFVIGAPSEDPTWRTADDGMRGVCVVRDEAFLEAIHAHNKDATGQPAYLAVYEPGDGGGDVAPGWYLRVWPTPDVAYTFSASFPVQWLPFTLETQVEPLGPLFDGAVIAHALEVIHARHPDLSVREHYTAQAVSAVMLASERQAKAQPKNLGPLRFTGRRGRGTESRRNFLLDSYNGVPNT